MEHDLGRPCAERTLEILEEIAVVADLDGRIGIDAPGHEAAVGAAHRQGDSRVDGWLIPFGQGGELAGHFPDFRSRDRPARGVDHLSGEGRGLFGPARDRES
jgi:hypothetical protein